MSSAVSPAFRLRAVCFVLFFGTLLLFSRALNHGFLDYDDPDYVTQNVHVQAGLTWAGVRWAFTSGDAANWHPLTWLSHMLDWQLFGNNPHGHHATSVVWHALNAVMAFLALRRLTGVFWTSAVSAALFAWHPLRVESVAWIAERKDVLSVFFGLATLWAYAAYAEKRRRNAGHAGHFYALSLATFATGLLCKPMLVTLPFLLLLLDWWPLGRIELAGGNPTADSNAILPADKPAPLQIFLEKLPFFLLAAASCIVTYLVQKKGGAVAEWMSLDDRLANAVISVARYLGKFFWPFGLAVGYPFPAHWPAASVAGAAFLIFAITGVAFWQRRRRPWLLVGWLWFLGTLVPVIGIVQVGLQAMADRYTYLPMLGVQLAVLWTLREVKLPSSGRWLGPVAVALMLTGCAARTWNQLGVWKDSITLYEHALAVTQDNYLAQCYIGSAFFNENHLDEAGLHLRRAIEIKPDYAAARLRLGAVLEKQGRTDEAAACYTELLKFKPNYSQAHYSLGSILLNRNQAAAAMVQFQAVLRVKPGNDSAYAELGLANAQLGRPQPAVVNYEQALALNPDNFMAHYNYANLLVSLDHDQEALAHYEKALQLNPDSEEAHFSYANLLRTLGRPAEACTHYRRALALQPKDADAYDGLGAALEDLGRTDEAMACYTEELQIKPDRAQARYNIGVLLLNKNQAAAALAQFEAARQSEPNFKPAYLGLGMAATQLGHPEEAVAHYRQALALAPDDAYAHFLLGNALYQTGRIPEAIQQWEQTQRLHPDFPGVAKALADARARDQPHRP